MHREQVRRQFRFLEFLGGSCSSCASQFVIFSQVIGDDDFGNNFGDQSLVKQVCGTHLEQLQMFFLETLMLSLEFKLFLVQLLRNGKAVTQCICG